MSTIHRCNAAAAVLHWVSIRVMMRAILIWNLRIWKGIPLTPLKSIYNIATSLIANYNCTWQVQCNWWIEWCIMCTNEILHQFNCSKQCVAAASNWSIQLYSNMIVQESGSIFGLWSYVDSVLSCGLIIWNMLDATDICWMLW